MLYCVIVCWWLKGCGCIVLFELVVLGLCLWHWIDGGFVASVVVIESTRRSSIGSSKAVVYNVVVTEW